jgi:starvation-inducible DNA-binding protein
MKQANTPAPKTKIDNFDIQLNTLLANEYAIYTKTRNAHWNINEPQFYQLHKFFENQYVTLDEMINEIALQLRAHGHYALGSLNEFMRVTRMAETKIELGNPKHIIQSLISDHDTIIKIIEEISPILSKSSKHDTDVFLDKLLEQHKKMSEMLNVYFLSPEINSF